jgi:hypothetical protein
MTNILALVVSVVFPVESGSQGIFVELSYFWTYSTTGKLSLRRLIDLGSDNVSYTCHTASFLQHISC